MLAVSIFKFQNDILIAEDHQNALSKYKQLMADLNTKITTIKEENNNLESVIGDQKKENVKLNN
jgi:septal ring factor EnvC (AmiA/AmiB activator)